MNSKIPKVIVSAAGRRPAGGQTFFSKTFANPLRLFGSLWNMSTRMGSAASI
jgi:hypothetical protein